MKPRLGTEEVNHFRNELQPSIACQLVNAIEGGFDADATIARRQSDAIVVAGFNAHTRAQRQGEVDRGRTGMKKIERPDIDGAAGEIDAGWGRRFNDHFL